MDKSTYALIALGIIGLLTVDFFAVFRGKGKMKIKMPGGISMEAHGENPPPHGASTVPSNHARISDARSHAGGATAESHGGSATIERVEAYGDLRASADSRTDKPDPK